MKERIRIKSGIMTKVRIPTPLRPYTKGKSDVQVSGTTVAEALQELALTYPELRKQIFNGDGQLRPFVNLFLNNENIKDLQGTDTPLKDSDRLLIIPSIAGGRE
jgi:MoaD family protein